jgi:NAD(P)-dependent dehydrogenase (short-subunit alcohol dehydrogenase family)
MRFGRTAPVVRSLAPHQRAVAGRRAISPLVRDAGQQIWIGTVGKPSEIAEAAAWLCASSYVFGQVLVGDGGMIIGGFEY